MADSRDSKSSMSEKDKHWKSKAEPTSEGAGPSAKSEPYSEPGPPWRQGPSSGEPRQSWRSGPSSGGPGQSWRSGPSSGGPGSSWRSGSSSGGPGPSWRPGPSSGGPEQSWRAGPSSKPGPSSGPEQSSKAEPSARVPQSAMRPRREPNRNKKFESKEVVKTKPDMLVTKCGTTGNQTRLLTNYFKVESVPNWVIYQYSVDFNVDEDREGPRKKWLREHAEKIGKAYIFDGSVLFTSRRLTPENKPLTLTSVRESDQLPVLITIKFVKCLQFGDVVYLQIFNILFKRCLAKLDMQVIRRNYFDPGGAIKIPQFSLEIWPGYSTAIKQHEREILLCAEIAHKVLRTDTALQLLAECMKRRGDYKLLYEQSLLGEIVVTDYNNKTYRVDDIDFTRNPMSTFKLNNNEEMTFVDYYQKRYRIRIRDLEQPLLVSRASQRALRGGFPNHCLLVPELCRMTGLSERMTENYQLMRVLSENTRFPPSDRLEKLKKFRDRLCSKPEILEEFEYWDLRLARDLLTVPGRELPPESLIVGRGEKYTAGYNTDWSKETRDRPMLKSALLESWAVVCPSQVRSDLTDFLESLRRAASQMDFRLPAPRVFETHTDRPSHMVEAVEDILARGRPDLIMFICLNNRTDRYNAIKKKCYVDRGIQSQVVLAKNLRAKSLDSVTCKIAIQMNCKIGGAPWTIDIPMDGVMVVGYDACHDTTCKGKTYGAVVCSLNKALSAWYSSVSHHSSGEELSNTLALDVWKALGRYREFNNGALPTRIFVYRDGVGEGQVNYVFEHEVAALKQRLTEIYGGNKWKMGYIIVSKRIKTRFFKGDSNPRPGTVVDDVVTLPERYDFYLVSQSVNSGTVTPTNYNVISDNLELSADKIQRWTYKMTHLYYNWTGTVRVPAPCQYAHKLAFLVSQSLHVQPNPKLDTSLYFL